MSFGPIESVVLRFADTGSRGDVLAHVDAGGSLMAELNQLARMHRAGVLTDAESTEAKGKLPS